jgi:hypothetical protein
MPFYQETRTMKGAVIGTIMPWTGAVSNIPKGWIICDGSQPPANEYPLLVQTIGDSYNGGSTNLGGGFPAYTGNFTLPNLVSGKMLMDIEETYFGALTDVRDNDPFAGNLIKPYIGTNTDNGINVSWNNVNTDVIFSLNERNGYSGNIAGNKIIDGEGEKSIFIGGRKLGHTHIRGHSHSGIFESLSGAMGTGAAGPGARQPGKGVIPYDNITGTFNYAAFDQAPAIAGSRFDDGEIDKMRVGISRWTKDGVELASNDNWGSFGSFTGFGSGDEGKTVMRCNSENPPTNLSPQKVAGTSLALKVNYSQQVLGNISGSTGGVNSVPFAQGGGNTIIPEGVTNYYDDVPAAGNYGLLLSNPGSSFETDTSVAAQANVIAHDHDPITVIYDQRSLKPQSRLVADVNIPGTTNLDNTSNVGVLTISMNTSQPSMTCIYIIRAY